MTAAFFVPVACTGPELDSLTAPDVGYRRRFCLLQITIYVEHPVPRNPPAEAAPPPPQPLKLTKKEQKKLRTQRRVAREKARGPALSAPRGHRHCGPGGCAQCPSHPTRRRLTFSSLSCSRRSAKRWSGRACSSRRSRR